ncbi:histidine kinase [Fluviicola sp.]|uniref:sensor histidine kinase n=1 Tax=Fluviicola sp. TaxID=1917219 RepID=UPI0031DCA710
MNALKSGLLIQRTIAGKWCTCSFLLVLLFSFSAAPTSFSQTPEWKPVYTHITVKDGLPSLETYFVHEDKKGYIWFCTDRGVVRYDGFRLRVFDKKDGLSDNVVFTIQEDPSGKLWFFCYNGTLSYYDPQTERIYPYKYNHLLAKTNHKDFNVSKKFTVDQDGNVDYTGGYETVHVTAKGKVTTYPVGRYRSYPIKRHTRLADGTWIFSAKLSSDRNAMRTIQICYSKSKTRFFSLPERIVKTDIFEINKHCFLRMDGTVVDLQNPSNRHDFVQYTGIFNVGGELWVTTLSGAYRFKNPDKADLNKPDGVYLTDQKVTAVNCDRQGGFWFATLDDGIYYTPSLEVVHCIPHEHKNENTIYDINGIGDNVYYASAFGYFELKSGVSILKHPWFDHNIGIWGNKLVLSSMTPNWGLSVQKIPQGFKLNDFRGWAVDRKNDFYTVHAVIQCIDHETEAFSLLIEKSRLYPGDKNVPHLFKAIAFDESNRLFLGAMTGLYEVKNRRIFSVELPKDLMDIRVNGLFYNKNWGLLVATQDKGMYIMRKGIVVKRIGQKDGLLSDQLNTVYVDKSGVLYAGTAKGVSRIRKRKDGTLSVSNLTDLKGLSSPDVYRIYVNKEGVYIATRNGITFVPKTYEWEKHRAHHGQMELQGVFTNGKPVTGLLNEMKFDASQKVIRFLLRTTNYRTLGAGQYKYRFRNSDPWSVGSTGELILINPLYESYQLEIRYRDENGDWTEPTVLTRFSIAPPFYQTFWFYILVSFLLLAVIVFFLVRRVRALNHKNEVRRNMEMLEQKALLAQMNPHFIFNALNSIQSFLLYNENEQAERYLLKLSKLIRMTLTNSRETEIPIQRELDSLIMYLELEQMRFKNRFEFEIHISLSHADLHRLVPPMLIQPFVENAIIHGFKGLKEGGKITLNVKGISDQVLYVDIIDNGHGYEAEKESGDKDHKSYGTQITSERLSLFQQKYQSKFQFTIEKLTDVAGNSLGTVVRVSIPVIN